MPAKQVPGSKVLPTSFSDAPIGMAVPRMRPAAHAYAHEFIEEVKAWQNRPLEPLYPVIFLDALVVKMRQDGRVENRAVYVAVSIDLEGQKDVLGLWTSANEGAKN